MKLIMPKRLYVEHKIVIRAVGWHQLRAFIRYTAKIVSSDAGYIVSKYAKIIKISFTLTWN